MIQIIIFSKDRPCQLDALLDSIKWFYGVPSFINILYLYSNDFYSKGYNQCMADYIINKNIEWHCQLNSKDGFKAQIENLSIKNNCEYITYFTDDDIIKSKFQYDEIFKQFENNKDILTLSLRLGLHVNFNYVNQEYTPSPVTNLWEWRKYPPLSDWGYPMSIQGNIFRREDIIPCIKRIHFDCPNNFEGSMYHSPINKPYMLCYPKSKVLGLQLNRVASTSTNRSGNISIEHLNKEYLNGKRLDFRKLCDVDFNSPDIELKEIQWM